MQLTSNSAFSIQGQMAGQGKSFYQLKLFSLLAIDDRDELGERLEGDFGHVTTTQNGVSENEGRDRLQSHAQQSTDEFVRIMDGLLYGILTDSGSAEKYYGDVMAVSLHSPEAFAPIIRTLALLINERFPKLSEGAKKQCLWLIRTFTKHNIPMLEKVYIPWLRNLTVGEQWKHVWLIESTIELFTENRTFMEQPTSSPVVHMGLMTFVHLIQYHHTALQFSIIKDKEMDFCLDLLKNRYPECAKLGRELVRYLLQISRMPKMKDFWNDLVSDPKKAAVNGSSVNGIPGLLQTPTRPWVWNHKITADFETKVVFLLNKVRAPQVARYVDIFLKQYLAVAETDVLLPELIRFVCRNVHPSNDIIASDVLQRWHFILMLLSTCRSTNALQQCILALFYDWMFLHETPADNNIMNIEPAILLLVNLPRMNVKVLMKPLMVTLLDYLCRIPTEFFPALVKDKVRLAIVASFKYVVDKGVVKSVLPIMEAVPEDQKITLRKVYPEIFAAGENDVPMASPLMDTFGGVKPEMLAQLPPPSSLIDIDDGDVEIPEPPPRAPPKPVMRKEPNNNHVEQLKPQNHTEQPKLKKAVEPNFHDSLEQLPESLQPLLISMKESALEEKCAAMETFAVEVINKGFNFDPDDCELLAKTLAIILRPIYETFRLPAKTTMENIEDSIQSPLFILFRRLWEEEAQSESRQRVVALLANMQPYMPMIGYLIVYYLIYKYPNQAAQEERDVMADYEDFYSYICPRTTHDDLQVDSYGDYIAADLDTCGRYDHRMLLFIMPFVYRECPSAIRNHPVSTRSAVAYLDASEIKSLLCMVLQRQLILFNEKGCLAVTNASFGWESLEQTYFWQLFRMHDFPMDYVVTRVLGDLDFRLHPEATMAIVDWLREQIPREDLVREVFRREPDEEDNSAFVSVCLQWTKKHPVVFAESVGKLIGKAVSSGKKRTPVKTTTLYRGDTTAEQVLGNLEVLRAQMVAIESEKKGSRFKDMGSGLVQALYNQNIHIALKTVKPSLPDSVKEKYREVFQLVSEDAEEEGKKPLKTTKRKPKGSSRPTATKSSDSEGSDDDDEVVVIPSKPTKKVRNKSPPAE